MNLRQLKRRQQARLAFDLQRIPVDCIDGDKLFPRWSTSRQQQFYFQRALRLTDHGTRRYLAQKD